MDSEKVMTLEEAIRKYVKNDATVTFGGFCARESEAAVYEIVREKKRDLHVFDDTRTTQLDILVGAGCVKEIDIAWAAQSAFDLGYNLNRAINEGVPNKVVVRDWTNAAIATSIFAAAANIPFMPIRSLMGSDIIKNNDKIKIIDNPFADEFPDVKKIPIIPAAKIDVAIIHAQIADPNGNAQILGATGSDDIKARAAEHVIITCERIVSPEKIRMFPNSTVIPSYCVDAVVEVPFGSHPWHCYGCYYQDLPFYQELGKKSRTYEGFLQWLDEWVLGVSNHEEYCKKLGWDRLQKLVKMEKLLNDSLIL